MRCNQVLVPLGHMVMFGIYGYVPGFPRQEFSPHPQEHLRKEITLGHKPRLLSWYRPGAEGAGVTCPLIPGNFQSKA